MSSFKLGQRGIRPYYPPKSLWARHYFKKVLENIFILNIQWQHWFPISQIPSLFLTDSITKANCQSIGVCSTINWERLLYNPVNPVLRGYSYFWFYIVGVCLFKILVCLLNHSKEWCSLHCFLHYVQQCRPVLGDKVRVLKKRHIYFPEKSIWY